MLVIVVKGFANRHEVPAVYCPGCARPTGKVRRRHRAGEEKEKLRYVPSKDVYDLQL